MRRDADVHHAVIATWQVSFDQILRENGFAANLLSLMGIMNRQGIPKSLLLDKSDPLEFEHALTVLCEFSLVTEESGGTSLGMHRLVQLATKEWLKAHNKLNK